MTAPAPACSRLLLTPGEPAGIGPDITVQIAQRDWPVQLAVIADPQLLLTRAKQLKRPLTLIECHLDQPASPTPQGHLYVLPVNLIAPAIPGRLDKANVAYVLRTLTLAASLCQEKKAKGLITGPVHKAIINESGTPFSGHTEFLAKQCQVSHTVMLFVIDRLRVALATTHLPLKDVPNAITKERLRTTLSLLQTGLQQQFHIAHPHMLVAGLNPHAGEGGYLGHEEIDIITPLIHELQKEHYHLEGPLPADTVFTPKYLQKADAILAMYHDQALPVVKYCGFDKAVNVTLGLPFIRTSVDHGTALELAGSGLADASSLRAAIELAMTLD